MNMDEKAMGYLASMRTASVMLVLLRELVSMKKASISCHKNEQIMRVVGAFKAGEDGIGLERETRR